MKKLRTFENFPKDSKCPICGTSENGECILIGVVGTEEGLNCKAEVFHTGCLEMWYDEDNKIIYQRTKL